MVRRPYDLPAMGALTAFEAAARNVSFRRAADELNVTPAAVSHQVKALEQDLGQTLFHRNARGVELSEVGALLLVHLQRGFEQIGEGVAQVRARPETEAVSIHVTTAMSSLWLTPRLAQFWKVHGNIPVSQIVSDVPEPRMRTDLKLVYGDMAAEPGDCRLLFHDTIAALASPEFVARHRIARIEDLADLPLIHFNADWQNWTGWDGWSAALGYQGGLGGGLRVNNYSIALQAARDGMGVVLGWESLTQSLIGSGELVRVLPQVIEAPMQYFIKARPNAPARALLLRDWLAVE